MSTALELIEELELLIDKIHTRWKTVNGDINYENRMQQDLLHKIEDTVIYDENGQVVSNIEEALALLDSLSKVRKRRREALNNKETIAYLLEYVNSQKKEFGMLKKGIITKDKMQSESIYTPKVVPQSNKKKSVA